MLNAKNEPRTTKKIILTGFGGQGIILAARILGEAAALGDHRESTFIQSYGPESRGGACSAQVIVSDDIIHYPFIKNPDILICMSQLGYEKFSGTMKPNGILLIDQDLIHPRSKKQDFFSIPATRMAEELGHKMMANIIMLGFLTAITKVVSMSAVQSTVSKSVPEGTKEINIHAFSKGCDCGQAKLRGRAKKATGQTGAIA